jgi:large subunit ribosomal protein L21
MLRFAGTPCPRFVRSGDTLTYAIIKVAGKQYRVREGERLLVDRLAEDDGATFSPTVLLVGGNDAPALDPNLKVTAKVLGQVKGPKIRIGKYKKRTGYRRHTGFRSSLTQIEIEQIGDSKRRETKPKQEPEAKKPRAERPAEAAAATEPEPKEERVKGMPAGYEHLTVAAIKEASTNWNRPMLEAALEYEQAHANRKGAIAAIESALADKEGDS